MASPQISTGTANSRCLFSPSDMKSTGTANSRCSFSPSDMKMIKVIIPSSPNTDPDSESILEMEIDPDTQIMDFLVRLCAQQRLTLSDYGVWAPTGVSGALEPCKASARIGALRLDGLSVPTPVHYLKVALQRRAQKARAALLTPPESACPSPEYYYDVGRYASGARASKNARGVVAPFELTQRVLVTLLPLSCHKKCVVRASSDEPLGEILYRVCQELHLDARSCQFVHPRLMRSSVDALHPSFAATLDLHSNLRIEGLTNEIYLLPPPNSTIPARYSNQTLTPRFPSDYSPVLEQQEQQLQTLHASSNSTSTLCCSTASIYSNRASTLAAPYSPQVAEAKLRQKPKMTDFLSFKKGLTLFHRSSISVSQSSSSPQPPQCDIYKQDKNSCDASDLNQASSRCSNSSSSHSSSPSLSSSTTAQSQINGSGRNRRRRAPLPPPLISNHSTVLEGERSHQDARSRCGIEVEDDMRSYSSGYHGSSMSPSPAGFENIEPAPIAKSEAANSKMPNGTVLPVVKKKGAAPKPPSTIKESELADPAGGEGEARQNLSKNFEETQHQYDTIDRSENEMTNPVNFPQNTIASGFTNYENIGHTAGQDLEKDRSISPENIYENLAEAKNDDESFGEYETQLRGNGNVNDISPGHNNLIMGQEGGEGDFALTFINSSFTTTDTSSALYSEVKRSSRELNDSIYSNISDHLKEDGNECSQLEFDTVAICGNHLEVEIDDKRPFFDQEGSSEDSKTLSIEPDVKQMSQLDGPAEIMEEHSKIETGDRNPRFGKEERPELMRKPNAIASPSANLPRKLNDEVTLGLGENGQKEPEPSPESKIDGVIKLEATHDEKRLEGARKTVDNLLSPSQEQPKILRTSPTKLNQNVTVQKRVSFFKLRTADVSEIVKRARNIPITEDEDAIDTGANQKLRAHVNPQLLPKNIGSGVVNGSRNMPSTLLDPANERPWTMTTLFRSNSKCQPNSNNTETAKITETALKQTHHNLQANINGSRASEVKFNGPSDREVEITTVREIENGHREISAPQDTSKTAAEPPVCDNANPKEPYVGMYTKGPNNTQFTSAKSPAIRSSLYSKFNSILSTLSLSSSSSSFSSNNTLDQSETKSCQEHNEPLCDACGPRPNEIQARDELLLQIRTCGGKAFLKKRFSHGTTNTLFQSG